MNTSFFLITGVMASGKSTVAEELALCFPKSVHLRGDVFRKMMINGREEMTQTPSKEALFQLALRYELAAKAAKIYFDSGFSVVLQDNYYGEALIDMLDRLKGYPVKVVVLCPDIHTVKEREAARGKVGYVGFDVEPLWKSFMETTPRVGFWLDTSHLTPKQTVTEILSYFQLEPKLKSRHD